MENSAGLPVYSIFFEMVKLGKQLEAHDLPAADYFAALHGELSSLSSKLTSVDSWPGRQLEICADYGVFGWFIDSPWGGLGWSAEQIASGYVRLAAACLTTAFVITQRTGACKRIAAANNIALRNRLLPDLASGKIFATLGISHLTTSRRHLGQGVLQATESSSGWTLNGYSPWVTGGAAADYIVVGAETPSSEQILLVVSTTLPGIEIQSPQSLVALSSSQTGAVVFHDVLVPGEFLLDGPRHSVLTSAGNLATGGLQTSALAIGLATAAVDFVRHQSGQRKDLVPHVESLELKLSDLNGQLVALANNEAGCDSDHLRSEANSFVLRATQSALVAAKGAGFVEGHCVGRWCREALFFLVWSCPQNVSDANLCEFAGFID